MLPKLPKMKSKNKQKKNNEVPTIMDEHTSVMIEKEEEDDDVNNNGDDEEEDYDEDDVDENVNTSEDAMELFVKLYNIVTICKIKRRSKRREKRKKGRLFLYYIYK